MYRIILQDGALKPFEKDIELRMENYRRTRSRLAGGGRLADFANAHQYYGFHHTADGWVYREWAPAADALFLTGDFNEQWPLFNDLEGWTVTNGRGLEFFGYDGLPFKRTTVDNILVTDNFTVVDVSMEDVLLSDHKPLFVMLTIE